MHELLGQLADIAEKIKSIEDSRARLGRFLREVKDSVELGSEDILESSLVRPVGADTLQNRTVVGIDGGLSQHAYHGLDMILTRAVAVICCYKEGKLAAVEYFPSAIVTPRLTVIADPYSDDEFVVSTGLERQRTEIELATEVFRRFGPDLLLLDGSVIPHGSDRPGRDSAAQTRYESVLASFRDLYQAAGGSLAGCVEDSRGRRFCEIVAERILPKIKSGRVPELQKILAGTRDTNLLYHVLEVGERTCVFRFSKGPHPITEDLGCTPHIYSFYVKTAEYDRPLRIDFYCGSDKNEVIATADRIASMVLPLCCHSAYGFPAPLIEADMRAKLAEHDITDLHAQLVDRVGITPSLLRLRRESRPL